MQPEEINSLIEIPAERSFVSIKATEAAFIYELITSQHLSKTLETGLGFGNSACHILAATGNTHIAIDPFQKDYDYLALKNVAAIGCKDQFDFREDYSHHVLPQLLKEGKQFDFIFIDGDHKFDGILVDFYYADLLLENNGYVLFHDTWMRSTQLVSSFIEKNKNNYVAVDCPLRNFHLFKKVGKDNRDGMHFKEFYTSKSILTYRLITWMTSPGDSWLKRMAIRLKEVLK
ncbi:MAG: class I SAM-dependent methyltransferase [Chitinophagales bacterium]